MSEDSRQTPIVQYFRGCPKLLDKSEYQAIQAKHPEPYIGHMNLYFKDEAEKLTNSPGRGDTIYRVTIEPVAKLELKMFELQEESS